jgi:predicted HAD superfamily Cof-like phosphohydrolase
MLKQLEQVKEFHEAFKITGTQNYKENPEVYHLRCNLGIEELVEYKEACEQKDNIEIADALGDQLYILLGTIISHGLEDKIEAIFDEIHKSNMSKLDENGEPIYRADGKVTKSKLFKEPNLKAILFPTEEQQVGKEDMCEKKENME